MTGRSLCCSLEGIKLAKRALIRNSLTQKALAEELGITRQPVGKFFTGKPVDRNLFVQICERLGLEWEEVVAEPSSEPEPKANQDTDIDIDALVQEVREKIRPSIQQRCGTMRVLDMSQPVGLNDIYTTVNILEKITGRRRKEIAELLQEYNSDNFERFGRGNIAEERVPGLEAVKKYSKLMILGKPGAGKTTFLKYLAIHCIKSEFLSEQAPVFITLNDFAEAPNQPGLLKYITQQFYICGVVEDFYETSLQEILNHGKGLILLDGLDEVKEEDTNRVIREIREFSNQFHNNHFVLTCRIAAWEYTFEKFTEVEIADFDEEQISTFASNWFKNKAVRPITFIQGLKVNNRLKELATNPLLLTLLCLVFEETEKFPLNGYDLYKEGLDALLKKWDAKKGTNRDRVYKNLSLQRKKKLLSKIAFTTFERADYVFKQEVVEQHITEYIYNLPDTNTDPEAFQLDSEKVLKSIEAQHGLLVERAKGIYSFSHLTFHEYFTATEIVTSSNPQTLKHLVNQLGEIRWYHVCLLATSMAWNSEALQVLKQQIDGMISSDNKLQRFLTWVNQKSLTIQTASKAAAVRAFYFDIARVGIRNIIDVSGNYSELSHYIDCNFSNNFKKSPDLILDIYITCILKSNRERLRFLSLAIKYTANLELKLLLQELKDLLPPPFISKKGLKKWHEISEKPWINKLKTLVIEHRNIGYSWHFSDQQKAVLKQYYNANIFLVECLNSDFYVSYELRQEIEDTLLLPIEEIRKRKGN